MSRPLERLHCISSEVTTNIHQAAEDKNKEECRGRCVRDSLIIDTSLFVEGDYLIDDRVRSASYSDQMTGAILGSLYLQ